VYYDGSSAAFRRYPIRRAAAAWRLQDTGGAQSHADLLGEEEMSRFGTSKPDRTFAAVAMLLGVLYTSAGLSVWLGFWNPNVNARSVWGLVGLAAGVMIFLGVWIRARSPLMGAMLVFGGAIPLAVVFAWTLLPPVLAAFLVLVWGRSRFVAAKTRDAVASRVSHEQTVASMVSHEETHEQVVESGMEQPAASAG
jgi:hypothetical protein